MRMGVFAIAASMVLVLLSINSAGAEVRTEAVEYTHDGTVFEGYMAYDDSIEGERPGVLVVHEWWGLNDYAKSRARRLAGLGYAAFAVDMYGKGVRPKDSGEAGSLAGTLRADRALMRARAAAGLEVLKDRGLVDPDRVAAIGYCFGGTVVLELARSGADIRGAVSFHGGLDTPEPEKTRGMKASILALHGGDDPHVKPSAVSDFKEEMRSAGADWQFVTYGGAVHSFTNPASGDDPSNGIAYNEKADKRSWEAMRDFLNEVFAR